VNFFRKIGSVFRTISEPQGSQHVSFGGNSDSGTTSFFRFFADVLPQVSFYQFDLIRFRIICDLLKNCVYLFKLQVDDIIHDTLGNVNMLFEEVEVKPGLRSERLLHIGVQIDGDQAATVVRTQGNFTAGIGGNRTVSQIRITIGDGFPDDGIPE